ncbi:MAG: hypothetical protein IKO55_15440 [Kiritimatiellae bacterium]|nr:hypothetical protein [Kiritimatiellia bacterium]
MAIETVEFDLSMVNPDTGRYNTARAYTVEGVYNVDGTRRELSIGQLVMAICLQRASSLEASIIEKMNSMELTSAQLEALTTIETAIIEEFKNNTTGHAKSLDDITTSIGQTTVEFLKSLGILNSDQIFVRNDSIYSIRDIMYDDFINLVESKMDEKNSFSQKTMIELQSLTQKRDQSYDMISNVIKSLNTVLVSNVNNF